MSAGGIPGVVVDINSFGPRQHGFVKHMLDSDVTNNTQLAQVTYFQPIVEHRVVRGGYSESIRYPNHANNWIQLGENKYFKKVRLLDLVDRNAYRQLFLRANPNTPP